MSSALRTLATVVIVSSLSLLALSVVLMLLALVATSIVALTAGLALLSAGVRLINLVVGKEKCQQSSQTP